VTAVEILEAAMPSADPASGLRPHAPSQPVAAAGSQEGAEGQLAAAGAAAAIAGQEGDPARRMALLATIGVQYREAVQQEDVEQYEALLGREHIFKCEAHA
jgi:hypothetical protein